MVHITSVRTYTLIFAALLGLTFATVRAANIDLGQWNLLIALCIAGAKATLVGIYFMHLRSTERLNVVFVCLGLFWLTILIGMTLDDILTRPWQSQPHGWL